MIPHSRLQLIVVVLIPKLERDEVEVEWDTNAKLFLATTIFAFHASIVQQDRSRIRRNFQEG